MAVFLSPKRYDALKRFVFSLDKGRCHICRKRLAYAKGVLDHIVPCSSNLTTPSSDAYWNLRIAHRECNASRGAARLPGQLRLRIPSGLRETYHPLRIRQGLEPEYTETDCVKEG
jgi:5-methylcytosine-specific restriction endonuclease McrA